MKIVSAPEPAAHSPPAAKSCELPLALMIASRRLHDPSVAMVSSPVVTVRLAARAGAKDRPAPAIASSMAAITIK
jgi:hypothetical protein